MEAGRKMLHYTLVEKIGEGGMGVVWKATDSSLGRDVAIKILPEAIARDTDRLSRFEREARLLASLNHPSIAAVYGFHQEDVPFIAMELIDGPTLAERIERGVLPVEEMLEVVLQICEALEAAHDRGIVHRDLKPANVKLRTDGAVKVLDFGLARATSINADGSAERDARTVTSTRAGEIMGTVPYMSPEQARGKPVCKRTDIWALGCLIFECLTGRRPFEGETTTDVMAAIVSGEPNFDLLPGETPPFLQLLLRRCLEKEPRQRLRDAGELRIAIQMHRSDPSPADAGLEAPTVRTGSGRSVLPWAVAALLALALIYVAVTRPRQPEATRDVSRWSIPLPPGTRVDLPGPGGKFDYSNTVAISPDGNRIAFSVIDQANQAALYLKADQAEAQPIVGTVGARAPFFSPDSEWLGFYRDAKLWKVALRGGAPQELCDIRGRAIGFDASWSHDGQHVLFTDNGVWELTVADRSKRQLTAPDPDRGEIGHHAPRYSSDGSSMIFTVSSSGRTELMSMPIGGESWELLARDAALGVPVGDDRIVYARNGELLAASMTADGRRLIGSAVPVHQGVHTSPGLGGMVMSWFDVSRDGTLVYVPVAAARPDEQLLWVDPDGTESVIAEGPGTWVHPRLSPEGQRIALDVHTAAGMRDIYLFDLARGQFQQLTSTGVTWESEWHPDGDRLAVLSGADAGKWNLHLVRADFSGPSTAWIRADPTDHAIPGSWSPDGNSLLITEWNRGGISRANLEGGQPATSVLGADRGPGFPRISPNGNWVAYVADEAGRREVFVQSYPDMGPLNKVSIDGGREPVWAHDGARLFYRSGDRMLQVSVRYGDAIEFGAPKLLFSGEYDAAVVGHQHYDIAADSSRFLMVKHGKPSGPTRLRVVLNWADSLSGLDSPGDGS